MNLKPHLTVIETHDRALSVNERAKRACQLAKQLEKAGDYEAAADTLHEFWPQPVKPPVLDDLDELTKGEVLLRIGALTGWLGSAHQLEASQETAKNLISRSSEIFERLGETQRAAEASGDLALCYWREGAYDEARIQIKSALAQLGGDDDDLKAVLLIRAGIVEVWDQKVNEALRFYYQAAPLLEESTDHALKGSFHNEFAILFTRLGTEENREDYLDRALIEAAAASFHYEQAGNERAVARVENNLGFLYFTIGRHQDAHYHLDRARDLFLQLKDVGTAAQVDETRARTLLAEGRLREAERTIKAAVKVLDKGGQQAVLAEALTTQGTIAARMGNHARAGLLLQRAIALAERVGDREGSGRAHLTIVEELLSHTGVRHLVEIYRTAVELLEQSQDPVTNKRLISCGAKVIDALFAENSNSPVAIDSWDGFSLREEVKKIERTLIQRALRDAGGSVTKAARLLGLNHHQSLVSLLEGRHHDLVVHRSAVQKRRRHLFSQPKRSQRSTTKPGAVSNQVSILHVEDHKLVARLVDEILTPSGFHVESCSDGLAAWEILKSNSPVDVLIVDNNLPGLSGLELVLRVRSILHRRNLPIIMLSGDDVERESWRAGVDAFLRKSEAVDQLVGTVARLVDEHREKNS